MQYYTTTLGKGGGESNYLKRPGIVPWDRLSWMSGVEVCVVSSMHRAVPSATNQYHRSVNFSSSHPHRCVYFVLDVDVM